MTDREDVKKYYKNLLILQYRNKPKARATIGLGADIYMGDGVVLQLLNILDIDTAEGAQLDIIGKILGVNRTIQGIVAGNPNYFQFHIDENSYGFSTVGDPTNAKYKSAEYIQNSIYTLTDTEYRPILKYKAMLNIMSASMANMDDILYQYFGALVYLRNNLDLTIDWVISTKTDLSVQALDRLDFLRPPIGINFRRIYILTAEKAFGMLNKGNTTTPKTIGGFATKNTTDGGGFFNKNTLYSL